MKKYSVFVFSLVVLGFFKPTLGHADSDTSGLSFGSSDLARDRRWQFDVGVGASFISPYYVSLPVFTGASSVQRKLGTAISIESSLCRDLFPGFSIGLMGGVTTTHGASVSAAEAYGVTVPYYEIRENLTVSKILPMIRISPVIDLGHYQLRPYVMGAFGGYQIDQNRYLEYYTAHERIDGRTDSYLGAKVGAGIDWVFLDDYTAGLEASYDRVFSPGQTLYFFIPAVKLGYLF